MSDLLDKLNVLLRSNLNNLLGSSREPSTPPRLPAEKLGGDIDRELSALRRQLEQAMKEEDRLQARLEDLRRQVVADDVQVDRALEQGNETLARQLVQRLQQNRKRAAQSELELERHRAATFDLMQHVNTLDAMVSDARRAEDERKTAPEADAATAAAERPTAAQNEPERTPITVLSDVLRTVRERVEEVITPRAASDEGERHGTAPTNIAVNASGGTASSTSTAHAAPRSAQPGPATSSSSPQPPSSTDTEVEEDLARRRSRLSKPE